ncbi:MAG: alpha/beta hydrolase [Bacteroidota bacterium]
MKFFNIKRMVLFILLVLIAGAFFFYTHILVKDLPKPSITHILGDESSKWVKLSFGSCHYKISGEGQPLILLHNTAMWNGVWDQWVPILEREYLVIRPDLPGCGLSDAPPDADYSLAFYENFLLEFANQLQLPKFKLAGLSLGGHIAWRFALDHGGRVSKLCLLNPTGFPEKEAPPIFTLGRSFLGNLIPYLGSYGMVEKNISKLFYEPANIPIDFIKRCHTSQLGEGNRRAFLSFLRAPEDFRHEELKNLSMPVQLIWSKELGKQPFSGALDSLDLHVLETVGNLPNVEKAAESVALALNFFEEE